MMQNWPHVVFEDRFNQSCHSGSPNSNEPCMQLRVEYIAIVVLSRATLRLDLMTK